VLQGKADDNEDPSEQNKALDHVRIDDSLDAADGVIDQGDQPHGQDGDPELQIQNHSQYQTAGVQAHTGAEGAAEEEDGTEGRTHGRPEAILQIFIDADQSEPTEEGEQQHGHADHGQRHRELILQPGEPTAGLQGDEGRDRDEADGRGLGRHGGQPDGPPGQVASAHIVVFLGRLAPAQEQAETDHGGGIESDDGPVERGHVGYPVAQLYHFELITTASIEYYPIPKT